MPAWEEAQYTINQLKEEMAKSRYGESGIPPKNMETFSVQVDNGLCRLTCQLPSETIIDGQLLCTPKGVRILRKENTPPMYPTDGDLIANVTTKEVVTIEDTNVQNDHTYYYAFFPYSDHDVFNINQKNVLKGEPTDIKVFTYKHKQNILEPTQRIERLFDIGNFNSIIHNIGSSISSNFVPWSNLLDKFLQNRPFMVKPNGIADYQLDPSDYTKKLDGSPSDYANKEYEGGAFAWIKKFYTKIELSSDLKTYTISYSNKKIDADYLPIGFLDYDKDTELEGVWIPMGYVGTEGHVLVQDDSIGRQIGALTMENKIKNRWGNQAFKVTLEDTTENSKGRWRYFGGPILNIIRDFHYMMGGSTNTGYVIGNGFTLGTETSDTEFVKIANVNKNVVVPSFPDSDMETCWAKDAYYGTNTSVMTKIPNKAMHSQVLTSFKGFIFDPYSQMSGYNINADGLNHLLNSSFYVSQLRFADDTVRFNTHYKYSFPYTEKNVSFYYLNFLSYLNANGISGDPLAIKYYGLIPRWNYLTGGSNTTSGTSNLGVTDIWRINGETTKWQYSTRLGSGHYSFGCGLGYQSNTMLWENLNDSPSKGLLYAIMLLPPIGYKPNVVLS